MASREIDLILRLRKDINKTQLASIREQLRGITKSLNDAQFSKRYVDWTKKAGNATTVFRGKINKLIVRMEVFRRRLEAFDNFDPFGKADKQIEKISQTTRRATKEFGGLARETIPKVNKVTEAIKGTSSATEAFSNTINSKLSPTVNSLTGYLEGNNAAMEMMMNDSRMAFMGMEMLGSSMSSNVIPAVHRLTDATGKLSASSQVSSLQVLRLGESLNELETRILKIQNIGSLRGILNFEQNVQSLRVFRQELEKLRMEIATVFQQKPATMQGGVTQKMLQDFKQLEKAIIILKKKSEGVFPKIEADIRRLSEAKASFDVLRKGIQETTNVLGPNIQQLTFHKEKLAEVSSETERTASAYIKLRNGLIKS